MLVQASRERAAAHGANTLAVRTMNRRLLALHRDGERWAGVRDGAPACAAIHHGKLDTALYLFVMGSESTGGDGDHAGGACDFDVVARGRWVKARVLQPHIIPHIAEGLIVEDKMGDPALEVSACSDTCRALHDNL